MLFFFLLTKEKKFSFFFLGSVFRCLLFFFPLCGLQFFLDRSGTAKRQEKQKKKRKKKEILRNHIENNKRFDGPLKRLKAICR